MCSQGNATGEGLGASDSTDMQWWTSFESLELHTSTVITRERNSTVQRGRKFEETSVLQIKYWRQT
jgi:hypothetical protein